jgi:hypothetical protein
MTTGKMHDYVCTYMYNVHRFLPLRSDAVENGPKIPKIPRRMEY